MLIELDKLKNMPVGSFEEQNLIGKISSVIISPEEQKILGFTVQIGHFLPKQKVVSIQDIVDIDQNGVAVRSLDVLVDKNEIIRIAELLKKNFNLIGLTAISEKKENLGYVTNALIESQTGEIIRIYIKKFFNERIFDRTRIVKITERQIILKDKPELENKVKIAENIPVAQKTKIAN